MDLHDHDHDHDRGFGHDLPRLLGRRRALALLGIGVGAAAIGACGSGDDAATGATTTTTGARPGGANASSGDGIPEETAGPYPGDGSNGPNVLDDSGVVRSDITSSFGSASGVAEGVPLTIELTVLDAATGDALPGHAVYLWHCDREGRYSMYSEGIEDENYLRGVQAADADGKITFTSIFPGAYDGRWPHIHFEVFSSVDAATSAGDRVVTSQLAFPEDACTAAYATEGYEDSVSNLARTSLESDMVFSDDGAAEQLATMSGDPSGGYTAHLDVPV